MIDFIKRLKLSYAVYNFFKKKQLLYNVEVYKRLGIKKSYFSPVCNADFKDINTKMLTADNPKKEIEDCILYKKMDVETQQQFKSFDANGFVLLKNYLSESMVDAVNSEIEQMLDSQKIRFRYRNKIMFAFKQSDLLSSIGKNKDLLDLLSVLIKGNATLFQSINFITGSEQKTHSDSIHMTTFPLGGLLGFWIALEDIDADNGPLHYYEKSHLLPYYLNEDYNNCGNALLLGAKDYTEYENMIEEKIKEKQLQKKILLAKKGDAFVWHANLFHGGEPHTNKSKTRKSMVFHYFDTNCVCYHEITQRPALMQF